MTAEQAKTLTAGEQLGWDGTVTGSEGIKLFEGVVVPLGWATKLGNKFTFVGLTATGNKPREPGSNIEPGRDYSGNPLLLVQLPSGKTITLGNIWLTNKRFGAVTTPAPDAMAEGEWSTRWEEGHCPDQNCRAWTACSFGATVTCSGCRKVYKAAKKITG